MEKSVGNVAAAHFLRAVDSLDFPRSLCTLSRRFARKLLHEDRGSRYRAGGNESEDHTGLLGEIQKAAGRILGM